MDKIPAIRITITRAEGDTHECGVPMTFKGPTCWGDANMWMLRQSYSFPIGSYHKHDLEVEFADGETFQGHLSCERASESWDIVAHILRTMEFEAGLRCPHHWAESSYRLILSHFERNNPGMKQRAQDFLARYQIGPV